MLNFVTTPYIFSVRVFRPKKEPGRLFICFRVQTWRVENGNFLNQAQPLHCLLSPLLLSQNTIDVEMFGIHVRCVPDEMFSPFGFWNHYVTPNISGYRFLNTGQITVVHVHRSWETKKRAEIKKKKKRQKTLIMESQWEKLSNHSCVPRLTSRTTLLRLDAFYLFIFF